MVKIRTATYLPRFAVGAISEVAARAVSSLIPAPAPASAIPAAKQVSPYHMENETSAKTELHQSIITYENVHLLCRRADDHSKYYKGRSYQSNISATKEVGERAYEWTDARKGEKVGQDLMRVSWLVLPQYVGLRHVQTRSNDPRHQYPHR